MMEVFQPRVMVRILPETPEELTLRCAALRRERRERFVEICIGALVLWLFMMIPVIGRLLND